MIYELQGEQVDKILESLFAQVEDTPQPQRDALLKLIQRHQGYCDKNDMPSRTDEVGAVLFMKAIRSDPEQCPWIPDVNDLEGRLHLMSRLRQQAFVD